MSVEQVLRERSNNSCELCGTSEGLTIYPLPPENDGSANKAILICSTCHNQIEKEVGMDVNHWRCLNDSMWNQEPAVQVISYVMLERLSSESWAQDALDMIYLEDDVKSWAERVIAMTQDAEPTLDFNGNQLQAGDNVSLAKDLVVKGANFTAKQGTMVRGISLTENPLHIEGKVNGTRIVIIAAYCKKSN
ncbi:PhnA domain protein [Thalassotalea sp. M1531]|uniref:PhnA domain protein n=1 Tax=Thalassotalea algicola TaxID=2716224 RepID=A0A7Y0Q8T2_9GAMM|nr:alkylphosphonate utilization protein [Thalassotalea algicola]NMP33242.1 PhnA domain protein [Thalassotalea algicola]